MYALIYIGMCIYAHTCITLHFPPSSIRVRLTTTGGQITTLSYGRPSRLIKKTKHTHTHTVL